MIVNCLLLLDLADKQNISLCFRNLSFLVLVSKVDVIPAAAVAKLDYPTKLIPPITPVSNRSFLSS
jgi:hypothetical protein